MIVALEMQSQVPIAFGIAEQTHLKTSQSCGRPFIFLTKKFCDTIFVIIYFITFFLSQTCDNLFYHTFFITCFL